MLFNRAFSLRKSLPCVNIVTVSELPTVNHNLIDCPIYQTSRRKALSKRKIKDILSSSYIFKIIIELLKETKLVQPNLNLLYFILFV